MGSGVHLWFVNIPLEATLIFAGIGLFLTGAGVREAVRAYRLRSTRATPVSSLTDASGRVVVSGVARRADETVTAPFTRREALAHSWHVEALSREWSTDGVRHRWAVVDRGKGAVPFLVDDGTGSVLVDPQGATLRLAEAAVPDYEPDPAERDTLDVDFASLRRLAGESDPRYFEARLDEGETVSVHGVVGADGARLDAGRVGLRISGSGTLVSDVDDRTAAKRSVRAAAVSTVLGLLVLGGLAILSVGF